jgi:hypothetical protein
MATTKLPIVKPGYKIDPKTGKMVPLTRSPGETKQSYQPRIDPKTGRPAAPSSRPAPPVYTGPQQVATGASALAPNVVARPPGTTPTPVPPPITSGSPPAMMSVGANQVGREGAPTYTAAAAGAPTVGGTGTYPTEKTLTGLASEFSNVYLPDVLSQPELIAAKVLQQRGVDPYGGGTGLMTAMTPYMDALVNLLPLAFGGAAPASPSSEINWLGSRAKMGTTPGGPAIDFRTILNTLQGLDPNSVAYQGLYGTGASPQDQVNRTRSILQSGAQLGFSPFFQSAVNNMMNEAALRFYGDQYSGQTPKNFGSYIPDFY